MAERRDFIKQTLKGSAGIMIGGTPSTTWDMSGN